MNLLWIFEVFSALSPQRDYRLSKNQQNLNPWCSSYSPKPIIIFSNIEGYKSQIFQWIHIENLEVPNKVTNHSIILM